MRSFIGILMTIIFILLVIAVLSGCGSLGIDLDKPTLLEVIRDAQGA